MGKGRQGVKGEAGVGGYPELLGPSKKGRNLTLDIVRHMSNTVQVDSIINLTFNL